VYSRDELRRIVRAARGSNAALARAVLLILYTAARASEALGLRVPELDLVAGVWRLPAERCKGKRSRVVALSVGARVLVEALLPGRDGMLFPAATGGGAR